MLRYDVPSRFAELNIGMVLNLQEVRQTGMNMHARIMWSINTRVMHLSSMTVVVVAGAPTAS